MNKQFVLSCESPADLSYSKLDERGIKVLFYTYIIDDKEYEDICGRSQSKREEFFKAIEDGALPTTSQVNSMTYYDYFKELLKEGDVLHLEFTSGLSGSCNNAYEAVKMIEEEGEEEHRVVVVDSLCACTGFGMFVEDVADKWEEGVSLDEAVEFAKEARLKIRHQFFATDMKMFKRSGRVNGPKALVATVLGICPVMHLDDEGRIVAYSKARGKKGVMKATVDEIIKSLNDINADHGRLYLSHADCIDDCMEMKRMIEENIPCFRDKITICEIGTIIASHCGPTTVAIFYHHDNGR